MDVQSHFAINQGKRSNLLEYDRPIGIKLHWIEIKLNICVVLTSVVRYLAERSPLTCSKPSHIRKHNVSKTAPSFHLTADTFAFQLAVWKCVPTHTLKIIENTRSSSLYWIEANACKTSNDTHSNQLALTQTYRKKKCMLQSWHRQLCISSERDKSLWNKVAG